MNFFGYDACRILSFPTRDQACASYIGRQSLNHWATRKVPPLTLYIAFQQDQFLEAVPFFCTESLYALFLDFGIMIMALKLIYSLGDRCLRQDIPVF